MYRLLMQPSFRPDFPPCFAFFGSSLFSMEWLLGNPERIPPSQNSRIEPRNPRFFLKSLHGNGLGDVPCRGFLGRSGARQRPAASHLPVSRVSVTPENSAWLHKKPSLWSPIPPTLHQTVLRAAPEPHRSTSDSDQRYYGEAPVELWRYDRAVGDAIVPINPKIGVSC